MSAPDKRRHPRVRMPLLVQYRTSALQAFKTDYASDISEGGVFLSTAELLPEGTVVFLQFVTRDGMHLISAQARVVRTAEGGQGVQFVRLDAADLSRVQALVERGRPPG